MSHPLAYLAGRLYVNGARRRLSQLRKPRYLVALIVGLVYLVALLPRGGARDGPNPWAAVPLEATFTLLTAAFVAWGWFAGQRRTALEFTAAEVTHLFPAPLPRRSLIIYKLLRWQLPLLANSVLFTVLFSVNREPAAALRRVIGLWMLFAVLRLHRLGASLVRSRWFEPDAAGRRFSPALVPAVLWFAALVWAGVATWTTHAPPADGARGVAAAMAAFTHHPIADVALAPFRLAVRPMLVSASAGPWAIALLPSALLLALHVFWVVSADEGYEAAAAAALAKRVDDDGRRVPELPQSARPHAWRLAPMGDPALAITWKQLASIARTDVLRRRALWWLAALLAAQLAAQSGLGEIPVIAFSFALVAVVATVAAAPQWIRLDLRRELGRLDAFRLLPLRGRDVVRGFALATWIGATLLQLAALSVLAATLHGLRADDVGPIAPAMLALLAALLPPLNAVGALVATGSATLFPGWTSTAMRPGGGIDALGVNVIGILGHLLACAVLLLLPAGLGLLTYFVGARALGNWGFAMVIAAVWVGVLAELPALLGWLGGVFERTEQPGSGVA